MPANWEWRDDEDQWTPYHFSDNKLIEGAFKSGASTFKTKDLSFNAGFDSLYTFDFKKLTQENNESGRKRKLRRIESGDDDDEMGFVRSLSFKADGGETPPPPAAVAAAAAAAAAAASPPAAAAAAAAAAGDDKNTHDALPLKTAKLELPLFAAAISPLPPSAAVGEEVGKKKEAGDADGGCVPKAASVISSSSSSGGAAAPSPVPPVDPSVVAAQTALGAQSRRKQPFDLGPIAKDPHAKSCFEKMLWREKQLVGEYSCFYHSYSFAALLYEVQSAVAAVLFKFKSEYATLPRLLKKPFNELPDVDPLLKLFPKMKGRDHDPRFRAVAISVTTSCLASDMEAPPKSVFLGGYSCSDLSFFGVLEELLVSCGVPHKQKTALAKKIVELSATHSLDVTQFKGKPCKSGRAGHMLQIFVRRSLVNKYAYAALPFGVKDAKRPDLEAALEGPGPIGGQARIVMNPSVFMRAQAVRMYTYSADPMFHASRPAFQRQMTELLEPIIGTKETRLKAAEGIYGGKVPAWFNPDVCDVSALSSSK